MLFELRDDWYDRYRILIYRARARDRRHEQRVRHANQWLHKLCIDGRDTRVSYTPRMQRPGSERCLTCTGACKHSKRRPQIRPCILQLRPTKSMSSFAFASMLAPNSRPRPTMHRTAEGPSPKRAGHTCCLSLQRGTSLMAPSI